MIKIKDTRIRNNRMFQEDQRMLYRKTQGAKQMRREGPKMEKFENFWAGISGKTAPKLNKENG